jgi:uncharacterized protein (TIRG00374 family)
VDAAAGSHWRRLDVFSAASGEPFRRRAVDPARLFLAIVALALLTAHAGSTSAFEDSLDTLVQSIPSAGDAWWRYPLDLALVYAGALVVVCAVARRYRLLIELLLAAVLAWAIGRGLGELAEGAPFGVFDVTPTKGHPSFPVLRLAVVAAVAATARPHLARWFRIVGHAVVTFAAVAAVLLGLGRPLDVLGGLILGWGVAALVHLALGAPGGHPGVGRIELALRDLGVSVRWLDLAPHQPWGSTTMVGDDGEPLLVRVYGRDAADAQLLAKAWRFLWYRDSGPTFALSRLQQVEHEAYLTLRSERAGVTTPEVVAAGRSAAGDAVLALRATRQQSTLANVSAARVTDDVLAGLWEQTERLHRSGIAHGALNAASFLVGPDGEVAVADFASASSSAPPDELVTDRAELLVSTALLVGHERALRAAEKGLGAAGLAATLPFLQSAALTPDLRHQARANGFKIEDLRSAAAKKLDVELPQLEKLQRVSIRSVVMVAITAVAAFALISMLTEVDLAEVVDDIQNADWGWLLAALVASQATTLPGAVAMLGAVGRPVPLGPLVTLQFSMAFTNLVVPSTVGHAAVEIRFFQKLGIEPARAVTQGLTDSLGGFAVQVVLLLTALLLGSWQLDFGELSGGFAGSGWLLLFLILGAGLVAVIIAKVSAIRRRIVPQLRAAKDGFVDVASSPRNVGLILAGNLGAQLLFAATLALVARGYGQDVSLWDAVLINTVTSLFAGLVPVPGGMGVAEAMLTAGLVTVGVPQSTAFTIAMTHRMFTYYLPPIWGWFAFHRLVRNGYL